MNQTRKHLILYAFLLFGLLASGALILEHRSSVSGRAFDSVRLNGQSFSGQSQAQAQSALEQKIGSVYADKLQLASGSKLFPLDLTELGFKIDSAASVKEIFSFGHRPDLISSIREQASLLRRGADYENIISEGAYFIVPARWAELAKLESPAQDFTYRWDGTAFTPVKAKEGIAIDQAKLKDDILDNLKHLRNDRIEISLVKDYPDTLKDSDKQALAQAESLIKHEVILQYDGSAFSVSAADFGRWLTFTSAGKESLVLSPDREAIRTYLSTLSSQIDREPVNAQLEFKDGKVGVFALSQDGRALDADASADRISQEIFQEKNYRPLDGQSDKPAPITVGLTVKSVAPQLTTSSIGNMGVTSLLATGESDFHGSTKSRVHNVTVGASKFQGVLIGPGDTFSFDTILGGVGPKEGYLPELVIKSGKTIPEYGGGLCQVSTTAFRGAVKAGLEIIQRTNHAYAVKYYAPQGTDATIYPPNPDLKFVNNTPSYVLIQTRIEGTKLYFDYYGTDDGRKVETEGPVVYERGSGGAMKTWWKQKVYKADGSSWFEKTFYSNYKSAALYPHTNPLE